MSAVCPRCGFQHGVVENAFDHVEQDRKTAAQPLYVPARLAPALQPQTLRQQIAC